MLWLGELLYPDYTEYDLQEEIIKYYKLFYGCNLTDAMYHDLIANAMPDLPFTLKTVFQKYTCRRDLCPICNTSYIKNKNPGLEA